MTTLAQLRERAERIQAEYERQRANLFRPDGEPIYGPAEHEERMRELQRARSEQLDQVIEEVRELVAAARELVAQFESGDVTSWLTEAELAAAAVRREFINDDVWALSPSALLDRLRAIRDGGDRVGAFLYWRAGLSRNQDLDDRDLREVLDELRAVVAGPERLARVARARETVAEAEAAELFVSRLRNTGTRTAAGAWAARRFRNAG